MNFCFKLLFTIFLISQGLYSQSHFRGIVLDSTSGSPISYVNIIRVDNGSGTVSNKNGIFELLSTNNNFVVRFSHISYKAKEYGAKSLKDTIYLAPKDNLIDEVVVYPPSLKKRLLKSLSQSGIYYENFHIKQFLKQNGEYVNYLEAKGVSEYLPDSKRKFYLSGIHKTNDLTHKYVTIIHYRLSTFLNIHMNILRYGKIVETYSHNSSVDVAEIKIKNDFGLNQVYKIYFLNKDFSIIKIVKDNLNQFNKKYSHKKIIYFGEGDFYFGGSKFEVDFKVADGISYVHKIHTVYKETLKGFIRKKKIFLEFISESIYVSTSVSKDKPSLKGLRKINGKRRLSKINVPVNQEEWEKTNSMVPLPEEKEIFKRLKLGKSIRL